MKIKHLSFITLVALVAMLSSCTTLTHTMREPNARLQWSKADFTFSEQVTGEATSTKFLNIDWSRLFNNTGGVVEGGGAESLSLASLPVIGTLLTDPTSSYALYELMKKNPGYDVIFYPQYEISVTRPIGLGFILKTTKVKATARLGKIN